MDFFLGKWHFPMETTSGVLVGAGWNGEARGGGGGWEKPSYYSPSPPGCLKTKILKVNNEKET